MAEYIEREQLVEALNEIIANYKDAHTFSTDFAATIVTDILENTVKCQAAANVAPVVRARWGWHEEWLPCTTDGPAECQSAGWECTNCHIDIGEYLSETLGETVYADNFELKPTIDICPSCGAKMENSSEET